MARRRMTLKRIDPWSVMKFGFIANLSLLGIVMLGATVIWFFIRRLELIEKVCDIAISVGFESCGVNGSNLFRTTLLLGALGAVVLTGIVVFLAFLHNLIAELVGGLSFTFVDDAAGSARFEEEPRRTRSAAADDTAVEPARPTRRPPAFVGNPDWEPRSASPGKTDTSGSSGSASSSSAPASTADSASGSAATERSERPSTTGTSSSRGDTTGDGEGGDRQSQPTDREAPLFGPRTTEPQRYGSRENNP